MSSKSNALRVLSAPSPICGQSYALSKGLVQLGQDAKSGILKVSSVDHNKYSYPYDIDLPIEGNFKTGTKAWLKENIDKYDVFHFHARSFFHFTPWPAFPTALDIVALKLAGKKVFFHFRGSEVRRAAVQLERNPYNYVESAPDAFARRDQDKKLFIDFIKAICDGVFVVDREVQENVGGALELPIILDLNEWDFVGQVNESRPLVIHAPSHQGIKGTAEVINAVNELKQEGLEFDFKLIEGLSITEARELYERSDIIIDQLKMGWFGTLTVEAMALGKPVICYLREDLLKETDRFPIVNTNPDNVKDKLKKLIIDSDLRNELAYSGRQYVIENHCHVKAAKLALKAYEDAIENPKPVNLNSVFEYMFEHDTRAGGWREKHRAGFLKEIKLLKNQHAKELYEIKRKNPFFRLANLVTKVQKKMGIK